MLNILSLIFFSLTFFHAGTMIPKSGGDYAYINHAFGPLPGFLYLWVALLVLVPTGNAITALTFAQYLLQPVWPTCAPPYEAVQLLAAIITCLYFNDIIWFWDYTISRLYLELLNNYSLIYLVSGILTVINCYNVKWVTRVTDIFTGTKILALLVIVAAGAWYLFGGNTQLLEDPFSNMQTSPGYIALAFYSGLFSYSGWNYLNFVTEELKSPYKWENAINF